MTLLLDTTVLVYAAGDPSHPLATPARMLIERAATAPGVATTTPEVLQEFLHVRARRRGREDARRYMLAYADLLTPLTLVTEQHVRVAASLFEEHARLGAFDSVLAAVALSNEQLELVSGDSAFTAIDGLAFRNLSDA